ncbi:hypothetical protein K439DRAFT_429601 [Ramaria rubella]|nr:hypothetical protein K439DRAFT_429601 [Ramaria rubella]
MPPAFMRSQDGSPTFYLPPEAPPFPPRVHNPIRPAHFPPSLHPPQHLLEPAYVSSQQYPPSQQPPQPRQAHQTSHEAADPPSQLTRGYSHGQHPRPSPPEVSRSHSQQHLQPPPPSQPIRSHSYDPQLSPHEYSPAPPVSRRNMYNVQDGVPPGLAPNGSYPPPREQPNAASGMPSQHQMQHPPTSRPSPPEVPRSHSQQHLQPPPPSQPIRSHSYDTQPSPHEYSPAPPVSRRNTYNVQDGVPPGLAPNGRYPPPHEQPNPASGMPSQHQMQHPPPSRSSLRDRSRHSLPAPPRLPPSPSSSHFAPAAPSPIRLPSQNVPTPQALGIVHHPPTPSPSGSPHSDPSRPPRVTPKPVMPRPLAPQAQEYNFGRGGTGQLQRSMSTAPVSSEKGGFLSKTKSLLRKRGSTTGIRTHADGAITFTPSMSNLKEENVAKLGKKLSRKK